MLNLLLIDGEHTREAVLKDLEFTKFMKVGAYLVMDDWLAEISQTTFAFMIQKPFRLLHESTTAPTDKYLVTIFEKTNDNEIKEVS